MTEIEKTEGEIKVLQAKLELLKEMENHKSPVEEAYKRFFGCYPHSGDRWNDENEILWYAFQVGYKSAKEDCKSAKEDCKVVEEPKPEREFLCNVMRNLGYSIDWCDEIVNAVEEWLPSEQSAEGSQNAYVECSVEGFNDCLNKIKGMLR